MDTQLLSFDTFAAEPVSAAEIDLAECTHCPIVDDRGEVYFFYGCLGDDTPYEARRVFSLRSPRSRSPDRDLIRLHRGKLARSYGLSFGSDDRSFKILDDFLVVLPDGGVYRDYGVVERESRKEHTELTRELFGLCEGELNWFARVFAECFQNVDPFDRRPRTTASNTRDNTCDLTRRWIPARFPYITFAEGDYYGSHISLGGFFELVTFLCSPKRNNKSYDTLLVAGIDDDTMKWICGIPFSHAGSEIYDNGT